MEAILVICATAFIGSGLTLVSGFGLGTLLVPVFGLFFPIEVAISLTAIVHFLNSLCFEKFLQTESPELYQKYLERKKKEN